MRRFHPGQCYAYRVDRPYQPAAGFRFNRHKLLIDPYARALTGLPQPTSGEHSVPIAKPLKCKPPGAFAKILKRNRLTTPARRNGRSYRRQMLV
jgi:hypothetical protein